jgi:clan AA aspartic protease (TIGR02281 family)
LNLKYLILVFSVFFIIVLPGHGEMYKWVDEKGTIHFADDLSNVPEKYRSEAEKRSSPRESFKPEVKEKPAPLPEVSQTTEAEGIEVPLFRRHELWLTEVLLNGRVRRYFILDSGASFTLINRQTALELGITVDENTPFIPVSTVSGVILTPLVTLKSVQVGRAELENVEALIYTMPSDNEGLLGNSFLNKFRVVIDSSTGKLTLHGVQGKPSPDRPGGYGKDYWAGQFRFYHRSLSELRNLKVKIEGQGAKSELPRVNNAIRYFENQLNELERKASFAGVPRNWRE